MAEASENNVAYALVLFETACYTLNRLLGESSICGWITAAMAIIVLYLETLPEGVARGAAVALPASIILYLLLCNNKKIKEDYRLNKEIQSQEDEETERQLAILEARMRGGKAEDGMPVEPMKKE